MPVSFGQAFPDAVTQRGKVAGIGQARWFGLRAFQQQVAQLRPFLVAADQFTHILAGGAVTRVLAC